MRTVSPARVVVLIAPEPPSTPGPGLEDLLAEVLALRDREGPAAVDRLLAAHPAHADRLREALGDLLPVDTLVGAAAGLHQLGDFRIKQKLGEGGMGIVYLAEQCSLGREVALKVVRPELLLFDGARERFRREIDAVARLDDPAIVPILATGAADGMPWYAMPRLRGCSAEAVVRALAGRVPKVLTGADLLRLLADGGEVVADAAGVAARPWWFVMTRLLRQAALGIEHAHRRGVLHRDLKPSNLMLTPDGRAVVLDFGLAQGRGDERLTRTGTAAGSPAYMAPELVRGEGADERTDVYGLGATLHCLLGLEPPFDLAAAELLAGHILAGRRRPLRERSGAPPELMLVVETAMDVERARRYPSAGAFAADLAAVLSQRPIAARSLPWPVRARRLAARHRVASAAAAAALFVLMLVPPVLWWQQRRANEALATQAQRADRSTAATLDAIDSLLTNVAMEKLRNLPAVQAVAAGLLDDALQQFERLAGDERHAARVSELHRRTLYDVAVLATMRGDNDKARVALDRLDALLVGATTPAARLLEARSLRLAAWMDLREGRFAECAARLGPVRQLLTTLSQGPVGGAARRELASLIEIEGGLAEQRGDREAKVRIAREHVVLLEQLDGARPSVSLLYARMALGAILRDAGDPEAARPLLEQAVEQVAACELPEVGWPVPRLVLAMAQHELASLEHDERHDELVLRHGELARRLFDDLVRDYPDDLSLRRHRGRTCNLVASSLQRLGRAGEGRLLLDGAIADQRHVLQRAPADVAAARQLAQHYRSLLVALRSLEDWPALETAARTLGTMAGGQNQGRAARDLLRCAAHADGDRGPRLADEALTLLAAAVQDGFRLDAGDAVYAPVRSDARFVALAARRPQ